MKKRFVYIDIINIIATFFVLVLHSSQAYFSASINSPVFMQTKIIQTVFIPAVLLFFMISGAMLLDYRGRQTTRTFFEKRLARVFIPFIIWSILWYIFDTRWTASPGPIKHNYPSIFDFINGLLTNNINNIFWFFYVILALYLVTPIFSMLAMQKKYNLMFGIVCVYFFINGILIYFNSILKINVDLSNIDQPIISSSYLGYFIIGFLIHKGYFKRNHENLLMVLGGISLIGSLVLGIMQPSLKLTSTTGMVTFMYSIGLFIGIKRIVESMKFHTNLITKLSLIASTNLGVYLIHPFFIRVLDKLLNVNEFSLIHIYLFPFVVYFLCAITVLIVKKIPFLKVIFP